MKNLQKNKGTLDFHSHPHNDDCVPSKAGTDRIKKLKRITGQDTGQIVTPNGRTVTFSEFGVITTGTIPNIIDDDEKQVYLKLFGDG